MEKQKPLLLICDDVPRLLISLRKVFDPEYLVTTATTLNEAKEFIRRSNSRADLTKRFAVVIIDLSFRKGDPTNSDGFSLLEEVVKDKYMEALIYTETGDQEKILKAMKRGAYRFVSKKPSEGENPVELLKSAVADACDCREAVITAEQVLASLVDQNAKNGIHFVKLWTALQKIRRRSP